jgi:hypothetical protein
MQRNTFEVCFKLYWILIQSEHESTFSEHRSESISKCCEACHILNQTDASHVLSLLSQSLEQEHNFFISLTGAISALTSFPSQHFCTLWSHSGLSLKSMLLAFSKNLGSCRLSSVFEMSRWTHFDSSFSRKSFLDWLILVLFIHLQIPDYNKIRVLNRVI